MDGLDNKGNAQKTKQNAVFQIICIEILWKYSIQSLETADSV